MILTVTDTAGVTDDVKRPIAPLRLWTDISDASGQNGESGTYLALVPAAGDSEGWIRGFRIITLGLCARRA